MSNRIILDSKKMLAGGWKTSISIDVFNSKLNMRHTYYPTPCQEAFHLCAAPNALLEGSKGTGKSVAIRNDAHIRALAVPGFKYLIVRKQMPELKKSHLLFAPRELMIFGGTFNRTDAIAYYPNDSIGVYGHCGSDKDVEKLLSQEYDAVYFDEMVTFPWDLSGQIQLTARVPEGSGRIAIVRGGTNPIGVSARELKAYFITHDVSPEVDQDYNPDEWVSIKTTLDDNPHIDSVQYRKRFSRLSPYMQRALRDGEWLSEGVYFGEFQEDKFEDDGTTTPYHVTDEFPRLTSTVDPKTGLFAPGPHIYRGLDWGWHDPTLCLWAAVFQDGRVVVFKERVWTKTTAEVIAADIIQASEGMEVLDSFPDPVMWRDSEATYNSIADIFERNGIPLSRNTKNDRTALGDSIHQMLGTVLPDGLPKLQIYRRGCPNLLKTLPEIPIDPKNPGRIPDGDDHAVVTLGYISQQLLASPQHAPVRQKTLVEQWIEEAAFEPSSDQIRRSHRGI